MGLSGWSDWSTFKEEEEVKQEGGLLGQGRRCLESAPVLGLNWLNKAGIADQNGVQSQKEKGNQRLSSKYELETKRNKTQSGAKAGTAKLGLYHVVGHHYLCRDGLFPTGHQTLGWISTTTFPNVQGFFFHCACTKCQSIWKYHDGTTLKAAGFLRMAATAQ